MIFTHKSTPTPASDLFLLICLWLLGALLGISCITLFTLPTLVELAIQTLTTFALPALLYMYIRHPKRQLNAQHLRLWPWQNSSQSMLIRWVLFFVALIALGMLTDSFIALIAEKIPRLQQLLKDEELNQSLITELIGMPMSSAWFLSIIVLALIPAFAEELFFRGALMDIIAKILGNKKTATIWITAAVFSLAHLSLSGFCFRLVLGAILGYFYYLRGNIKWPIAIHLLNNLAFILFL